jgi:hypothetical protein
MSSEEHFLRLANVPLDLAMMKSGLLLKAINSCGPSTDTSNCHHQEQRAQSISKPSGHRCFSMHSRLTLKPFAGENLAEAHGLKQLANDVPKWAKKTESPRVFACQPAAIAQVFSAA